MTQFVATVTVIVNDKGELQYVGDVGQTESDAWRLCLGWPRRNEVEECKRNGWYAAQATITVEKP